LYQSLGHDLVAMISKIKKQLLGTKRVLELASIQERTRQKKNSARRIILAEVLYSYTSLFAVSEHYAEITRNDYYLATLMSPKEILILQPKIKLIQKY